MAARGQLVSFSMVAEHRCDRASGGSTDRASPLPSRSHGCKATRRRRDGDASSLAAGRPSSISAAPAARGPPHRPCHRAAGGRSHPAHACPRALGHTSPP
eukprot:803339-Prymnesium_polylepis.1